jgi:DNA modification methylase
MRPSSVRKTSNRKGMGAGVRLHWEGRTSPSPPPAVSISRVNGGGAGFTGLQTEAWRNTLVQGDNLLLLSNLLNGDPARAVRDGVSLIYIDPPFAMEADFHIEELAGSATPALAFSDSWGSAGAYLQFMHERLVPMRELLSPDGVLCVHCDWRANSWLRLLLDEVFGRECFRNEIIWRRAPNLGNQAAAKQLGRVVDTILVYTKTPGSTFRGSPPIKSQAVELTTTGRPGGAKWDQRRKEWFTTAPRGDYTDASIRQLRREGRVHQTPSGKVYIKYPLRRGEDGLWYKDQPVDTLWTDDTVKPLRHCTRSELDIGYPTQKPLGLLKRIIEWTTREGDLVADFFCGSGTTLAAAQQLGRRWIGCDIGERAIRLSAERLSRGASVDTNPFDLLKVDAAASTPQLAAP